MIINNNKFYNLKTKRMKRLLLLSVMFCIGVLQGFAQTFTYTDENGVNWECSLSFDMIPMPDGTYKDTTYVYINSASNYGEEVTVPGVVKYEEKNYTITQLSSVFRGNKTLKKVTLPKSITSLGDAFAECPNLTEVVNTEQILSCSGSFYNCTSLKNIDLSNCEEIGGGTFEFCNNLQSVNLKKCKSIGFEAFLGCHNLQSIGDLSSCITITSSAFSNCSSLKSVDISSCNTLDNSVFNGCSNLEEVKLSKQLNTISESTFSGCTNLKNIDLSYCTTIEKNAFINCYSLSDINLSICQSIGSAAFADCKHLEAVSIPNTIKYMGYKCFNGNTTLTLYAKNVPTLDERSEDYADMDHSALGKNVLIIVPEESLAAYQAADVWNTMSERIFPMGTQFEYNVEANAQASTSGLQKAIGEKNLRSVVTLKVKGR